MGASTGAVLRKGVVLGNGAGMVRVRVRFAGAVMVRVKFFAHFGQCFFGKEWCVNLFLEKLILAVFRAKREICFFSCFLVYLKIDDVVCEKDTSHFNFSFEIKFRISRQKKFHVQTIIVT